MSYKIKTQEIIGGKYRHALFYRFPGGLRFALSEGDSPLDMAFLNKPALAGLYERHHDLLQDHDIVAMHESFGPL